MGSPSSWEFSKINAQLEQDGWQRGGLIIPDTQEYFSDPAQKFTIKEAQNISFVVDMPWMLPLEEQASYLNIALKQVMTLRPEENISLIGHSAGALAARLWLIQHYNPAIVRLISIAAPNLGTPRAIDALRVTSATIGPIDAMRNLFGGKLYNTVRRSRKLVREFTPPSKRNQNILYWMNQQPHPEIEYISIVREDRRGRDQDWLMSADSQDLNNVPALRGKSEAYIVNQSHELHPEDGALIASLLRQK
ncbi:MAG: hypothetical protein V3V09_09080 [Arenicellales bacterium]